MNFEYWLNQNCEAKDFSEESNQAKDFLHTSDVIEYVNKYLDALKNMESSSLIMSRSILPIEERIVIFSFKGDDKEKIEIPEIHRDWEGKIDVEKLLTKYHKALIAAENDS